MILYLSATSKRVLSVNNIYCAFYCYVYLMHIELFLEIIWQGKETFVLVKLI